MALLQGFPGLKALYDVECYPNYISVNFLDLATGQIIRFRLDPDNGIDERIACEAYFRGLSVIVSYNGHGYDDHVLSVVFKGLHCENVFLHGDDIIRSGTRRYSPFLQKDVHGYPLSIDLARVIAVSGHFPGLKELGNKFSYKVLQDLPYPPGSVLTDEQKREIDEYNIHDLNITRMVLAKQDKVIEMRRVMSANLGVNVTSHSEAALGVAIIKTRYFAAMSAKIAATWDGDEEPPPIILCKPQDREWVVGGSDLIKARHHKFVTPSLITLVREIQQWTLKWKRQTKGVGRDAKITMETPSFNTKVPLGDKIYSLGMGGLHSEDAPSVMASDEVWAITDIDVGSFYPGMMGLLRIAPAQLDTDVFCDDVYKPVVDERLHAKYNRQPEKAQAMKIAVNGIYGKLGDKFSEFLDPPKGAMVTLNGQLCQLRLIEALLAVDDLRVLSCNTDGVLLYHKRADIEKIRAILAGIGKEYQVSGFDEVDVIRVCRASINVYVMSYHGENGKIVQKTKGGAFNADSKQADKVIIRKAATNFLLNDTPIAPAIRACADISQFIGYARLDSAWSHVEDAAGNRQRQRTNRWYEATSGTILYKVKEDGSRAKFPGQQAIVLANNLPDELPDDINYDHYIEAAEKLVEDILRPKVKRAARAKKIENLTEDEREELIDRQTTELPNIEYLLTLDLNCYRDLYLSKHKFNFYDSMKSVLARLWNDQSLRLTRADLIWVFESLDSGQGYFERPDKRKSLLSFIEFIVDNAVPFDKDVFPIDDTPIAVTVDVLDDEPGGGKTRYALGRIVHGGPGTVYWWAINKIAPLASERHTELMARAEAAGVEIDFLAIHSEAKGRGTMKMRVDARMKQINEHPLRDDKIFVTIITHRTLIDHSLRNVSGVLFIDEPTEVWEQRHFKFPKNFRAIRQLIQPKDIRDDYDSDINARIDADTQAIRLELTEEGREEANDDGAKRDSISGAYHWILEQADQTSGRVFVTAEQWNVLEEPGEGDLNVLALLHPVHVAHFDECWMMAAYFRELLIFQLWSDLYDVTWKFRPIDGGWTRTVPLSERVTIYYVLENRDITDTYLTNGGDPKRRRAMARSVAEFYGDEPFIWSANTSHCESGDYGCLPATVIGVDGDNHPGYLTPKANGINAYQNLHGAAWLGSIKLSNDLFDIIGRVWGASETRQRAIVEYEFYAAMQFLARANSRRFDSVDQVRYVVADYVQAAYIARTWNLPPERVLPLPMRAELKANLDDVKGKGTGRKKVVSDDQRLENHRARSAKNRADKAAAEGRQPSPRKRQKAQNRSAAKAT